MMSFLSYPQTERGRCYSYNLPREETNVNMTSSDIQSICKDDYNKLKEEALTYYSENKVPEKMEQILNEMFFEKPYDVYGHLANYFENFCKPSILSKIKCEIVLNSTANPALATTVYCKMRNSIKSVATSIASSYWDLPLNVIPEHQSLHQTEINDSVRKAFTIINDIVNDKIVGLKPELQQDIDLILCDVLAEIYSTEEEDRKPEDIKYDVPVSSAKKDAKKSPKGKRKAPSDDVPPPVALPYLPCGAVTISAVSQAVCLAGARVLNKEPFEHIAHLFEYHQSSDNYYFPQPIITLLQSGRMSSGKVKCMKEVSIVPRADMPLSQCLDTVEKMVNHLNSPSAIKSSGSTTPAGMLSFDRPELFVEIINKTLLGLELTPGEDFSIFINCGAQDVFDLEKGKYDVSATLSKSPEELVEYWTDLVNHNPVILGLIDPLRKEDVEQWTILMANLSNRCYVVADYAFVSARQFILSDDPYTLSNAAVIQLNRRNSVTDLMKCHSKCRDLGIETILSVSAGETPNSFLADLAVGLGIRFIKISVPTKFEHICKLSRLAEIEESLNNSGKLGRFGPYIFFRETNEDEENEESLPVNEENHLPAITEELE